MGSPPSLGFDAEATGAGAAADTSWECADCGWNVDASRLLPGWTLSDARERHGERYCGRPPTWPPAT